MNKAQGALEYLLLIGGAVVIALTLTTLLLGVGGSSQENTESAQGNLFGFVDNARNSMETGGSPNLINEGGFEVSTIPPGWDTLPSYEPVLMVIDSIVSHYGTNSLKMVADGSKSEYNLFHYIFLTNSTSTATYTVSGYVKTDLSGGYCNLVGRPAGDIFYPGVRVSGTTNWTYNSVTFSEVGNGNPSGIYLMMGNNGSNPSGSCWFDDIRVVCKNCDS